MVYIHIPVESMDCVSSPDPTGAGGAIGKSRFGDFLEKNAGHLSWTSMITKLVTKATITVVIETDIDINDGDDVDVFFPCH